jgi:hypothetical protein
MGRDAATTKDLQNRLQDIFNLLQKGKDVCKKLDDFVKAAQSRKIGKAAAVPAVKLAQLV